MCRCTPRAQRDLSSPTAARSSTSPSNLVGQQRVLLSGSVAAKQLAEQTSAEICNSSAVAVRPSSFSKLDPYQPVLRLP